MKTSHVLFILILLIASSCKNDVKTDNELIITVDEVSIADTLSIKFNGNDKWLVNSETHEGVNKMDSIISEFNSNRNANYQELGDALSKQTSYIIKNCTMIGEPHDQLHVVLVPMLDEISVLRETENDKESEKSLDNLKDLIQAYYEYFKL